LTILKPASFEEAAKQEKWIKAIEEEIKIIKKKLHLGASRLSKR